MILSKILYPLISQLAFVFFRTLNVKYTAKGKMAGALITGTIVAVLWVTTTAIGIDALKDLDWISISSYLTGGLIGNYWGMLNKSKFK